MKKPLKSLLAAVLVITMLLPNLVVFAATRINYSEEKFLYIPSERIILNNTEYRKLTVKNKYEGLSQNAIIFVDSNYNLVTDRNLIEKLAYVNMLKSNIVVGSDALKITNLADVIVEKSDIIESLGNTLIESTLGNAITGNIKGLLSAFRGDPAKWSKSYLDFIGAVGVDTLTYLSYVANMCDLMDMCTKYMTELYDFYASSAVKNINQKGLNYTDAQKYEIIVRNCMSSLNATEYYVEYLAKNVSGNNVNNSVDAFDVIKKAVENGVEDLLWDAVGKDIGKSLADTLANCKNYNEFFANFKKTLKVSDKLSTYYNSYVIIDPTSATYIDVNDVIKNVTTLTGTTSSTPSPSSSSTSKTYSTGTYKPSEYDGCNIRSGASTSNSIVGAIVAGTNFVVTKVSGNWGYTTCNGKTGWVCLDFATFINSSASSTSTATATASKYTTGTYKPSEYDGCNIRSGASTSNSIVGAIAAGTNFVVTKVSGNWGYTTCNGKTGWVCLDYATYLNSSTSSATSSSDAFSSGAQAANSSSLTDLQKKVQSKALSYEGSKEFRAGLCQGFVWRVFYELGIVDDSRCCAANAANSWMVSSSSDIPIGAAVYFSSNTRNYCDTCGRECGHVGIYVGDGYMIHNWNGKIVKEKISTIDGYAAYSYVGYGWHGGKALSSGTDTATKYYLDLNGDNDGTRTGNIKGYGTVDVYINGSRVADDVSDYYTAFPAGTTYEIKDIKGVNGNTYYGVYNDVPLQGTIQNGDVSIFLSFGKNAPKKTYTVSYYANGGEGAPDAQTKTETESISISNIEPTRTGYTFLGWSTTKSGNVSYTAGQKYTADADLTLYAVWKADTYTIVYNANGGSGAPANRTKTYGEDTALSAQMPERSGYTFLGWSTSANGGVEFVPGAVYTANQDLTLYAVWQEEQNEVYYIIYNSNGGDHAPAMQTKNEGETVTISTEAPTRAGYTFAGWAIENSDTIVYAAGAAYTENKTCYLRAVWTANTYTVSYQANGGVDAPQSQVKTHDIILTLSDVLPKKDNYRFVGWATDPAAKAAEYFAGDGFTENADTTLYAVWETLVEEAKPDEPEGKELPFEDIPADAWYRNDVESAYKSGLINGKSEKRYAPNDNITYAEAVKLACTIYQLYYNGEVSLKNGSDVWYSTYMDYALENRIVRTDYSSVANQYATRKEFVSIFYGALPLKEFAEINTVNDNAIPDVKIGDAYSGEIYTFYRAGILTGNDAKGTFTPERNISRSEVAALVTRMLDAGTRKSFSF